MGNKTVGRVCDFAKKDSKLRYERNSKGAFANGDEDKTQIFSVI